MAQRQERDSREETVRVGTTFAIPAVLRRLGVDPAEVLAEAGLDLKLFDDPDNLISYAARSRLISLCVARTNCSHFGLLLCERNGLHSLGLVGYLVQHSATAGTALRDLVRFFRLHARGGVPTLAVEGDFAFFGFRIHSPGLEAADQIMDGAIATAFNIMHQLCGRDWKPIEVLLAHRKPEDTGPFRRFFRAPLRFDAAQSALVFSADWLERPVPGADPELRRLLQKQVDALAARYGDDFPEQVRALLRTALLTGHSKADQIATLFSMHRRTLNRRLAEFGTTFQELVDASRYEAARQMLESSAIEVSEIAAGLGYADASAFTRAFRRWSGTTPALWRAERKTGRRLRRGGFTPTADA
jgi:AraC-like DNA-binding protein